MTRPSVSRIAAAAAAPAGVAVCLLLARRHPAAIAAMWSVVLIASFVGWGSVVKLWVAPRRRVNLGLRAGWGLAFYVLTGGFVCGAHLAVRPVLVAHVALGVAALAVAACDLRRPSPARVRRRLLLAAGHAGTYAILAGACAMAALTFLSFLGLHWFNPSDDLPFYFTLAEKLTQTSSLFEPFAARRIATFGAQVYLHATFISVGSIYYLHAVDGGIAFVVVFALLVGHVKRGSALSARHALPLGLAVLLLFTLQDVRLNTNSETSGLAAILTLYRSVRVPLATGSAPPSPFEPRRTVLLACLMLTALLLRISNAPAVLAFAGMLYASEHLVTVHRPWSPASLRSLARTVGIFTATAISAFLPWSILQKQSSGTFFYPLGHSNVTPGWTLLLAPKGLAEEGDQLLEHLFYGKPLSLLLPFVLAGLVPLRGRARNNLVALSLATLVGLAAFSHEAVAFGPSNTSRYLYATVAGMGLLVMASVERRAGSAALAAVALAMHVTISVSDIKAMLKSYIVNAHGFLKSDGAAEVTAFDAGTPVYRELQSKVPPGATVATAVNESFRFDFKRNRILALDVLGGMGPSPGWPAHKGPDALAAYLRQNGVQYLAWVDFNGGHEFYGRAHWSPFVTLTDSYLQGQAILQLDAEDSIEKLSAAHRVAFRGGGMTLVDLDASR